MTTDTPFSIDRCCFYAPSNPVWLAIPERKCASGSIRLSLSLSLFLYFFVYLVHWSICPDSDDVFVLFF